MPCSRSKDQAYWESPVHGILINLSAIMLSGEPHLS
jgi:hypothetical protein